MKRDLLDKAYAVVALGFVTVAFLAAALVILFAVLVVFFGFPQGVDHL